jgi:hypothetical protein
LRRTIDRARALALSARALAALSNACSGDDSAGPVPLTDAGVDATLVDAGSHPYVPDAGDAAACVPDASLTGLMLADASLNDAGTASVGLCFACAENECTQPLVACDQDCTCAPSMACFFTCLAGGAGAFACTEQCFPLGAGAAPSGATVTAASCLSQCASPCGFEAGAPMTDASAEGAAPNDDAGDAGLGDDDAGDASDASDGAG